MRTVKGFFLEYKDEIGSLITAFARNLERGPLLKFKTTVASFLLVFFTIGLVAYLGILGIVSGDAVAFLLGTIVGYLFSFLRHHLIGGIGWTGAIRTSPVLAVALSAQLHRNRLADHPSP